MKKNLTTVMFRGTKAQEEQLIAEIEALRDMPGSMMPILQKARPVSVLTMQLLYIPRY